MADLLGVLNDHIHNADSQWSVGTFGGIAEFSRNSEERAVLSVDGSTLSAVTGRGGIRIQMNDHIVPFASESISKNGWSHRIALCLPEGLCGMNQRTALTELGSDEQALRAEDREGILFDLGLGVIQTDLCVRTKDYELARSLRDCCGTSIFASGNPAMKLLLANGPHRVFVSRIGRAEVYQPIPPVGGQSPDGPHTHVLPKLLAHGRTHPATEPIPSGLVPCAYLYPAHPLKTVVGQVRPFDLLAHQSFQQLLGVYGDTKAMSVKENVRYFLESDQLPQSIDFAEGRLERANIRLALRQFEAQNGTTPVLKAWLAVYERQDIDPEEDQLTIGH